MISHANTSSTDPDIQQRYAQFPLQPKNEGKADAPSADDSWPAVRLRAKQKSEASAEWQLSAAEAHLSGEKMGVSAGHSQQGSAPPTTAPDSEPLTMGEAAIASLPFAAAGTHAGSAKQGGMDKRAEAKMKGYVGESCPECANFTLVRNGTCLKCDTCGSTTGCS